MDAAAGMSAKCGGLNRRTRPPSWSIMTSKGLGDASLLRSAHSVATCSGSRMLRSNMMHAPHPFAIISRAWSSGL